MKRRGRKEGATGSHTTHNINNRDEDNSQNGGEGGDGGEKTGNPLQRKDYKKICPDTSRTSWPRCGTSHLGQTLFVDDYELFFDPAGRRVCLIGAQDDYVFELNGWLKLTVAIICKHDLAQANPE